MRPGLSDKAKMAITARLTSHEGIELLNGMACDEQLLAFARSQLLPSFSDAADFCKAYIAVLNTLIADVLHDYDKWPEVLSNEQQFSILFWVLSHMPPILLDSDEHVALSEQNKEYLIAAFACSKVSFTKLESGEFKSIASYQIRLGRTLTRVVVKYIRHEALAAQLIKLLEPYNGGNTGLHQLDRHLLMGFNDVIEKYRMKGSASFANFRWPMEQLLTKVSVQSGGFTVRLFGGDKRWDRRVLFDPLQDVLYPNRLGAESKRQLTIR